VCSTTEGHDHLAEHGDTDVTAATDADCDAAHAFYDEVVAAAAAYEDLEAALADGYVISNQSAEDPSSFDHYFNAAYQDDGTSPDSQHPEGLMYNTWPDGTSVLVGVVFISRDADPEQPGGAFTVWHDHHDPDIPASATIPKMLHVWLFDDATDVFAHSLMEMFPGGGDRRAPLPF
jgi:hypothetical protein